MVLVLIYSFLNNSNIGIFNWVVKTFFFLYPVYIKKKEGKIFYRK